jgi:transcriptional regulator GlxA family with amidase domain
LTHIPYRFFANKSFKMAAVEEGNPPIEVLFALHPNFNLMDYAGPLEVLHCAQHNIKDPSKMDA